MIAHGDKPYLECSSQGEKRLSAFSARIRSRGGRSIEELYQAAKVFEDGVTGLDWRAAKGKQPENLEEVRALYSTLWDEYIAENPDLLAVIASATGLSDVFGKPGSACQATELWRIRTAHLERMAAGLPLVQAANEEPVVVNLIGLGRKHLGLVVYQREDGSTRRMHAYRIAREGDDWLASSPQADFHELLARAPTAGALLTKLDLQDFVPEEVLEACPALGGACEDFRALCVERGLAPEFDRDSVTHVEDDFSPMRY